MYFVFSLGCMECAVLAVMFMVAVWPYDTLYATVSSCATQLAISSWMFGFLGVTIAASLISISLFCGPNIINTFFFCDTDSWIPSSCSDTHFVEMVCLVILSTSVLSSLVVTFTSVLVSAGIELIILAAGTVPCFGFSVRITLITR